MNKILTVRDLTVEFHGRKIIENLDLDLEAGEVMVVIGPNGSGKTVLLKTLLGIIPYTGKIEWASNGLHGYIPQKIDADRHLPLTMRNFLDARAGVLKLGEKEVNEVIETVKLSPEVLSTPVGRLSGGQFQKALIAFALLGDPKVVFFDEPTASLDQLAEEHIYELIHELRDKKGITAVLVSHDLSVVYRHATRVLCLNKSRICYGPPREVLNPEVLEELYGGPHKLFHHVEHDHHHGDR